MSNIIKFTILVCLFTSNSTAKTVVNGFIDLSDWNRQTQPTINLDGTWEFYWQQLLSTEQIRSGQFTKKEHIQVPFNWAKEREDFGYATYRTIVELPSNDSIGIYIGAIWSASKVWVNGQPISTQGQVAANNSDAMGKTGIAIREVLPSNKSLEIVIQASNFDLFIGGIVESIIIGNPKNLVEYQSQKLIHGSIICGAILIIGLYHLVIFSLRTKDRSPLYFSLICFGIFIHWSVAGGRPIQAVFPGMSQLTEVKIYNIGWITSVLAFQLFLYHLFPKQTSFKLTQFGVIFSIGFILFVLFSSQVVDFVYKTRVYQIYTGLTILYCLFVIIKSIRAKEESSYVFAGAALALFAGATHDMLAIAQILPTPPVGAYGLVTFLFAQAYLIARRFSMAFFRVEKSEQEIRILSDDLRVERDKILHLNQNLEELVDEKTRDIRAIMDDIPIGVFSLQTDELTIHKDYSKKLEDLLQNNNLEGMLGLKALLDDTNLSVDEKHQIQAALLSSINELDLSFEINSHCLPRTIIKKQPSGEVRYLDLSWSPMLNNQSIVTKILVTAQDVTDIRKLEDEANEQKEELKLIGEIVHVSESSYAQFMKTSYSFLEECEAICQHVSKNLSKEDLKIIFIDIHTMKGSARSMKFKQIATLLHGIENELSKSMKGTQELTVDNLESNLFLVKDQLDVYKKVAEEKLGRFIHTTSQITIPKGEAMNNYQSINKVLPLSQCRNSRDVLAIIKKLLATGLFLPSEEVFASIFACTASLAKDLNKAKPIVDIDNSQYFISYEAEELLRKVFVHLIRNSMDHGIESANERIQAGKSEQGTMKLRFDETDSEFIINFGDDGRGLQMDKIREIALGRNLLQHPKNTSSEEIAQVIFHPGFTTAVGVSEISGRGVGMGAVKEYIRKFGGDIKILIHEEAAKSKRFLPFSFEMRLPKAKTIASRDLSA